MELRMQAMIWMTMLRISRLRKVLKIQDFADLLLSVLLVSSVLLDASVLFLLVINSNVF